MKKTILLIFYKTSVKRKESSQFSYRARKSGAEYQLLHDGDYYRISGYFDYGFEDAGKKYQRHDRRGIADFPTNPDTGAATRD